MVRAQAQAVTQRTQAITNQDSFQLVKCLIRVSVYHVCWMRGLFPEGSFTGHDLAQLDQLHVKMLEPNEEDDEANTLKNWVEQGVMDAVAKGCLKNMYFGISQDAAGTQLLEEYVYSFKYGGDGCEFNMVADVHEDSTGKKKKQAKFHARKDRPGVDDVRYQVVRLMRMLVQLCQTLDKVPDERYMFIKLTYHNHTPEEYEPPYFHGVAEEGIGHFHRRPFSMDVGSMDTHHHTVSVRVKSVLDSCDDDEGPDDKAMMELQASQQMPAAQQGDDEDMLEAREHELPSQGDREDAAAVAGGAADLSPSNPCLRTEKALALLTATEDPNSLIMDTEASPPQAALQRPADSQDVTRCTDDHMDEEGGGSDGASGGCSGQGAYESVRSYCLVRPTVSYTDLISVFYNVTEEQLVKVLDGLTREGLLQAEPDRESYTVLHPTTAAVAARQPPTTSEGIMAEAGAGSGGSVAAAGPINIDLADDQMLTNQLSGLSVGAAAAGGAANKARGAGTANASVYGAAMRAGSLMTGQPDAPAAAPTAADPQVNSAAQGDEPSVQLHHDHQQGLWMDASQQSFQGPADAAAAGGKPAGGGAERGGSRLRKASYVNSPIYQRPGKRGPGRAVQQQQQEEVEQQQGKEDVEEAEGEVEVGLPFSQQPKQQAKQRQKDSVPAAAPAAGAMAHPRRKLTVRKPKKPAAATDAAAGTPSRGGGRLAAMRGLGT